MAHTRSRSLRSKPHGHVQCPSGDLHISAPTLISTNAQGFPELRSISPTPSLIRPRSHGRQGTNSQYAERLRKHNQLYNNSSLYRHDSKLGYRPGQYGTLVSITSNDPRSRQLRAKHAQSGTASSPRYYSRNTKSVVNCPSPRSLKTRWTNHGVIECTAAAKPKVSRWKTLGRLGKRSTTAPRAAPSTPKPVTHNNPISAKKKADDSQLYGRSLAQPISGPYSVAPVTQSQPLQQPPQRPLQQEQLQQRPRQPQPSYRANDDTASLYGHNPLRMNPQLEQPSVISNDANASRTSPPRISQRQRSNTQRQVKSPLLDVAIPKIEMERYSVMFGNILQQKDMDALKRASTHPPRAVSLLARRHASLKPLETSNAITRASRGAATAVASEKQRAEDNAKGSKSAGLYMPQAHPDRQDTNSKTRTGVSPSLSLFPHKNVDGHSIANTTTPPMPFTQRSPKLSPPRRQPPVPPKKEIAIPKTPPMPARSAPTPTVYIPDLRRQPAKPSGNTIAATKFPTVPTAAATVPAISIAVPPESPESMTSIDTASSDASFEPSNISVTQFPMPAGVKPLPSSGSPTPIEDIDSGVNEALSSFEFVHPTITAESVSGHRQSDTSMEIGIALGDPCTPIQHASYAHSYRSANSSTNNVSNFSTNSAYANCGGHDSGNGGTYFPYCSESELEREKKTATAVATTVPVTKKTAIPVPVKSAGPTPASAPPARSMMMGNGMEMSAAEAGIALGPGGALEIGAGSRKVAPRPAMRTKKPLPPLGMRMLVTAPQ